MAATLLELTTSIVSSHASKSQMTGEELLQEIQKVYGILQKLEIGRSASAETTERNRPAVTVKKAFQEDEVFCMICGKGNMKTLTRHLTKVHGLRPGEYRKQFGIPRDQPLTARNFSNARRKMAKERGLSDNLAKAREVRAERLRMQKAPKNVRSGKKTARIPKQKEST